MDPNSTEIGLIHNEGQKRRGAQPTRQRCLRHARHPLTTKWDPQNSLTKRTRSLLVQPAPGYKNRELTFNGWCLKKNEGIRRRGHLDLMLWPFGFSACSLFGHN
jgi:hypothetical protein